MYSYNFSEELKKILKKLSKKDKVTYEKVLDKINEIIDCENIEHYKNLKYNMKDSKRVHIGHFVLVFQFNKNEKEILFDYFDHHDKIYKR